MRLIDAEELIKCIPAEELVSRMAVANAPTIEQKTGKWIYRDGTIAEEYSYSVYCSNCGEWSEYYTNFCGACGADMRGEADE